MMVDGTWDTQKFTGALGSKVAAFVPPFSNTPIKGVVDFAGDGLSMTNYSQHSAQALQFLEFMTTSPGREDHQRRRADPRHQRHVHAQPGEPADAELRQPGPHDRLPDAGQRGPGQRGEHRQQGAPVRPERQHLAAVGAVKHADHLASCQLPSAAAGGPAIPDDVAGGASRQATPCATWPQRAGAPGTGRARPAPEQARPGAGARAGILLSLPAVDRGGGPARHPDRAGRLLLDDELERAHRRRGSGRAPTPRRSATRSSGG